MKVLVCGGRNYSDVDTFFNALDDFHFGQITQIISGGARGADTLAAEYAKQRGIPFQEYPADWITHGRRAGYLRNLEMADAKPDFVVAFPGGKGTEMMKRIATQKGIPIYLVEE